MINILVLALVHQGVGIPLVWLFLPNRSNAYTYQRIVLMQRFRLFFPAQAVAFVSADREFIGREWVHYLYRERIGFRVRIRDKELLDDGHRKLKGQVLFAHLRPGHTQVLNQPRKLWEQRVYIAAARLDDGALLLVATSDSPDQALADYATRWHIETLFGCLKTRGFCLESTHLSNPTALSKLLALLTLALSGRFARALGRFSNTYSPLKSTDAVPRAFFGLA